MVSCQWLHKSKHMTRASWLKNDPLKVACMNTVASRIDHTRLTYTDHGVRDVCASDFADRLAHRFGRGRQNNIADLDEAGDENPRPQFRFAHFTTPIEHRFGADTE
ncbi:hypothetical protein GCM10027195_42900 [Comamonas sediminis]